MVTLEAEHLTFDWGGGGRCMVGDLRKKQERSYLFRYWNLQRQLYNRRDEIQVVDYVETY